MKLIAAICVCAFVSLIEARIQSVGVRGTLMCGQVPLSNTVVKLWDEDSCKSQQVVKVCRFYYEAAHIFLYFNS